MFSTLRHIGLPSFKKTRRSSTKARLSRTSARWMTNELLEARTLMAGDTGFSLGSASLFAALSRGHDAMITQAGYSVAPTNDNLTVSSSVTASSGVSSTPAPLDGASTAASITDTVLSSPLTPNLVRSPAAAVPAAQVDEPEGEAGDVTIQIGAVSDLIYNANTGNLRVASTVGITTLEINSKSGIFTRSPALNLGGPFDVDSDTKIFKLDANGFSSLSFGTVAQTGLTDAFLRQDLVVSGSPVGGGVLSNKPIRITVDMTNLAGAVITEANVGEEFLLRVRVKDTRPTSLIPAGQAGVFSAYLDVSYDAALADPVGNLIFDSKFNTATSGTVTDGLLDEIGAISSQLTPTGAGEQTIITLKMKTQKAGTLQFSANSPDILPAHEVLLFGSTSSVPAVDMNFETKATLTVVDNSPKSADLVAFAKALAASGAKMYGAYWCPHCTAMKELFEDGQYYLPYVETTNPDRTPNQAATDNNIQSYPTWIFADGTRLVGEQTLAAISQAAKIAIPESNGPVLKAINNLTVLDGSPLFVPLDGWDPNDDNLTYTVEIEKPALLTSAIQQGNRSLQVDVNGFGKMLFQLFDDKAPRVTERMTTLASQDFYDGLKFHRILNNFVIQGGDPNGNGSGGSSLPDFDDQFHVDLQHNQTGLLSMAKSSDDTNNSQFFITEGPTRHLDSNHSVWGMLIEGEKNRDNISNVATNSSGVPTIAVTMSSVDVVQDKENALTMLKAVPGARGTSNVTIKVRDPQGHEASHTFAVTVAADTANAGPFLNDIPELSTTIDTPLNFQLTSQDVEGDAVTYAGDNGTNLTLEVNATTGAVKATPKAGFVGVATATVKVRPATTSDTMDVYDSQLIRVKVLPAGPTGVDLLAVSDTGISNTDNITNASELQFQVSGVTSGAVVSLLSNGNIIGEATATGNTVNITTSNLSTLGDNTYAITARQKINGTDSAVSPALSVVLDQTVPGAFTSTAPSTATVGALLTYNAQHPDEGKTGFRYSLSGAPDGAVINANTGVLTWTPTSGQAGARSFSIVFEDVAGNKRSQNLSVNVESLELMRYRVQVSNAQGAPLDAVATGQEFNLQVFVKDLRDDSDDLRGVFAAYLDVNYPANLIQANGLITYSPTYPNARFGSTTTAGVINDAGGTADTTALGREEFLLMTIPMKAIGSGTANFTTDPADEKPLLENTMFGLSTAVRDDQISFGSTSVTIAGQTFAADDTFDVFEDSSNTSFTVLANDIGVPSGVTLSVTEVGNPGHGTATRTSDNQRILYTPTANFFGLDTFTYTIRDSNGKTSTATVRVNVANTNDPPTVVNDTLTVAEDTLNAPLDVLANDSSAPDANETLTIVSRTDPAHGTAVISSDGKRINYTPTANYSGPDTFKYTVSDGKGGTSEGTINLTVTEVNDAPIANNDVRSMQEDTVLTIPLADLLANDNAGPAETNQTLKIISVSAATPGATAVLNTNNITVTPAANFVGTLTFTYTIEDNGTSNGIADKRTAVGTVNVNVTNVNDPPTAVADSATANSGAGAILIDVLANDSFAPDQNETLSIKSVSQGSANGTIEIVSGKVRYTPANGYSGLETFTYVVADNNGGQATGNVSVNVNNYVAGGVKGYIFNDSNSDGTRNDGEKSLAGTKVLLTGTDVQGNAVERTMVTDATGQYYFDQLIPGTYAISQAQLSFTVDGSVHVDGTATGVTTDANSFNLELTHEGVDGVFMNFTEQGLEPKYSIWDALASSTKKGFHSSVNKTGGQQWNQIDSGWAGVSITDVRFNADQSQVTITILEGGKTLKATLQRSDRTHVQVIGQDGDNYLVRIRGDRSEFNFQESV